MRFTNNKMMRQNYGDVGRFNESQIIQDYSTDLPYYEPREEELRDVKRFLMWNKIGSGAIAIFWSIFPCILIATILNNNFDPALLLFLAIFGGVELWLLYRFIQSLRLNSNNCSYCQGSILDSWVERHRDSDGDTHYNYYVMVGLSNGKIIPEIRTKRKYLLSNGKTCVVIYHKNKIIGIIPSYNRW